MPALTVASLNTLIDDAKRSFDFLKNHPLLSTTSTPPGTDGQDLPTDVLSRATRFLQQTRADDIVKFVANPRLDDPAYLTTLAIALAAVFVTMSWFSRAGGGGGGWGGRFSPFGRPGNSPNAGVVNDSDFSYITNEDLRRNGAAQPEIVDWDDKDPDRKTDVLAFKVKRDTYVTHFPAHSIRDGDLRISTVRQAAAKKLGIDDPRRVRMFYKGRNLKHDDRSARDEGLRGDGSGSEILVTVGESPVGGYAPGAEDPAAQRGYSEGEDDDDDDDDDVDSGANTSGKKKPRKRGGRKNKKKGGASSANASGTSTPGYVGAAAGSEYLPIPSHFSAQPRPTSAPPPSAPRAATPQTPQGKLDAIASKFHTELVPMAIQYMNNPPQEKAKREFEYKKLSETILTQIIFKLDGVETEGDPDARTMRKALVKEVQGMLGKLDEVGKAG